jgi:two-component system response regulator AtoC
MHKNLNILIIDGNPSVLLSLRKKLDRMGYSFCSASSPDTPIEELKALSPDLAILGPSLDFDTCLKTIQKLKIIDLALPVLVSSLNGFFKRELGTVSFQGVHTLSPDLKLDDISETIEEALRKREDFNERPDFQVMIGQSQEIRKIRQQISQVADKDITVLITGESGTGKELIARSIHYHSSRHKGPLVKITCGALPDELLESEIFGFQQGAFTGAHKNKPGRIELASGGTLFIDEVGNLSLSLQVKFLQALEEKSFSRLGDTQDKTVDARVIAATNADLSEKVREGTFRRDLFFRLNVMHIVAPALRKRKEDIPWLLHYFMNKYSLELKKKPLKVPDKVINFFGVYQWPGNVREFENVVRRGIVLRDWNFIFKDLSLENGVRENRPGSDKKSNSSQVIWGDERIRLLFKEKDFSLKQISKSYVSEVERRAILKALKLTHWNRKKAAELLNVSYKLLLNRIAEFDLKT